MSMIAERGPNWYSRGWDDYDNRTPMGQGLFIMHMNGEPEMDRRDYKRGWRDALVVDLADTMMAPRWMKNELGV